MPHYQLAGRTVAITGGIGGFARALAPALRRRGANVALLDLDADVAVSAAAGLGDLGVARGWRADVRNFEELQTVMADVAEHFGRLDVVMANAALGGTPTALAYSTPARFELAVDVGLTGVYRTFLAGLPFVTDQRGYLLATSSMAAFVHGPLQGSYSAYKAGLWALCDEWRLELRHTGVGVGSLHPTFFKTPMMDEVVEGGGSKAWGGNDQGAFGMAPIETIVEDTIRGIEARSRHIFAPRRMRLAALAPMLTQRLAEAVGFKAADVQEAVEATRDNALAGASGTRD